MVNRIDLNAPFEHKQTLLERAALIKKNWLLEKDLKQAVSVLVVGMMRDMENVQDTLWRSSHTWNNLMDSGEVLSKWDNDSPK